MENSPKSVSSETSDPALVELSTNSVPSDSLDVPLVCEDIINENTTCEHCGFKSKSSRGLKVHIRTQHRISQIDGADDIIEESKSLGTQTEQTCDYCRDIIESLDKHYISGFCPKNIEAQRIAFSVMASTALLVRVKSIILEATSVFPWDSHILILITNVGRERAR